MKRAWWWILDYAFAVRWQFRGMIMLKNPRDYESGSGRPVVVIPGIYESWQFLRPIIDALYERGHPVHVVTALQHNQRPVKEAAALVSKYISERGLRDVVIVAHSKGGLIGKFTMLKGDPDGRVRSMVAVCSPFSGSRYARFMLLPSLRAFSPGDATTSMLARELDVNARITSIFGLFDPHIPESSVLPGAQNIQIDTGGHFRILGDERTIAAILTAA